MVRKRETAEQKLARYLATKKAKSCLNCSYYSRSDQYCRDLDVHTDEPVCSDENYYA